MAKSIGIDLGTTNCCVYFVEAGKPTPIPNREGRRTTPSVVAFTERGERLVGTPAQRQAVTNPRRTVFGAKRLMGRKFKSAEVTFLRKTYPYEIVEAVNGDAWIRIGERDYSPQEISSFLLQYLKESAEDYLGEAIGEAVVTVPAFFDDRQRQATKDAGTLAGLNVARILNEPTAAALAYGYESDRDLRLAVFDLGGGTFDISIMDVTEGVFEVLSNAGDTFLGGDDFDRQLIQFLIDDFREKTGVDLSGNAMAMQRLNEAARQAKHDLSQVMRADINLPFIIAKDNKPLHLIYDNLTRDTFERLVEVELESLTDPCQRALDDAELSAADIEQIILVGGMTRAPSVQRVVEQIFGAMPSKDVDPDEVVAMGAALQASIMSGELREVLLLDVTPHSLGLRVMGGRFSRVISRNSRVPCRESKLFAPVKADQDFVVLEIYQGESDHVKDNTFLGRFTLSDIPLRSRVEVSFSMDTDGMLRVDAVEQQSGRQASIEIHPWGGLTQSQMERLLKERESERAMLPGDTAAAQTSAKLLAAAEQSIREPVEPPEAARALAPAPAEGVPELVLREADDSEPPAAPSRHDDVETDRNVGRVISDRYSIEALIGEGGMAKVYRAKHNMLNKPFAIKILSPAMATNKEFAQRFLREARAASSIDSAHVVDISDYGELDDGSGYFVMEYLEGLTLAELIDERGALPVEVVRDIGVQLTEGLAAAHALQIVHRDLKPDNVTLLERGPGKYFCKILDFGIAKTPVKQERVKITMAGAVFGTPHYMSPEQVEGAEVDHRADIYALGVVLYEMTAGRRPFESESVTSLFMQHKFSAPPPLRNIPGVSCPPALEALIMRCLAKERGDRFQSMAEVAEALRAF